MPDSRTPARHELPEIDAAALRLARDVDRLIAEARGVIAVGAAGEGDPVRVAAAARWAAYFQRIPDQLRDDPIPQVRLATRRARAAYGPKDSIRDVFDSAITEPLLDAIDRLLKAISRYEAHRD